MAKKRGRIVNTQPFISDDASDAYYRKRSKVPKTHQKQEKLIDAGMSSKIMKEALFQQKEVADEENAEKNPYCAAFSVAAAVTAGEEQRVLEEDEEAEIDGFDEDFGTQSEFDNY